MKVVLLCGGLGTRMREETEYKPKPLVDIGGKPMVWHIMKTYAHYGFRDFVLCLGYKGNLIKEYFLNYEAMNNDFTICLGKKHTMDFHGAHFEQDFRVTLADTGHDTMTGGRVRRIEKYIDADTFMVTYGDGVANVDISSLLAFHKAHGKIATVTAVRPVSRFGILNIDERSAVTNFVEKPELDGWANAGYFVFNREIFDYLDSDQCILEQAPLQHLANINQLAAFQHNDFFYAMDTYREYKQLNDLWSEGAAPWKVWSE